MHLMSEFFRQPIDRRESLRRIGTLVGARPLVSAARKLALPAAGAAVVFGAMPANPGRAEEQPYTVDFEYNKSQQRVVKGNWVNTLPEEAPWPCGPSRNFLPMTHEAARRWGKLPAWADGGIGQKFDKSMRLANVKVNGRYPELKELMWSHMKDVYRLGEQQGYDSYHFESFGYCYAYGGAAVLMREPLKHNIVAGVEWNEDEIKGLMALGFANIYEEPATLGMFLPNEAGIGKPLVVETIPNFYNPTYGVSRDLRWVSAGDLQIPAWNKPNQAANTLVSISSPHHPNAAGEIKINPVDNDNHGWSILSQAPLPHILKIAYVPNPQF